jgi:hypothetical protein
MALTINLNHQLQPQAIEIYDVSVNRSLSQERVTQHFASLQLVPEQHFSQGAAVPEFSRALFQFWIVVKHGFCCVQLGESLTQDIPLHPLQRGNRVVLRLAMSLFKGGITRWSALGCSFKGG